MAKAPIVLFATDADGVITLLEGQAAAAIGLTSREACGQSVFAMYADNRAVLEALRRALSGEAFTATVELSGRAFETRFFPVRDERGAVTGTTGVAVDVTEQRLVRSHLLAAERTASLGTLAAGVAHEINNPLTYVALHLSSLGRELGKLAHALEGDRLDLRAPVERGMESLRIAREGTERIARIVRDLRTFARADDERRGPLDVRRVLDSAIALAWNELRHRARVAKEYMDVSPVDADEARLGQVFLNLLLNAAQALPEGDASHNEVRVVVRPAPDGSVVVEVRDTGPGIPEEIRGRVFDPFFTTRGTGAASGLGLSICQGIVTGLGGTIEVEDGERRGTVVRVTLPAFDAVRASARPSSGRFRVAELATRPRALVIDDEPLVADAIRDALASDVDVVLVDSGRAAIDLLLCDQRFDVVLCDVMMPDIGGMDVYEAVRRARPGVEERFVFVTGGAFTARARDFLKQIPNPCLDKPLDIDELRRLMMESRGRRG